MIPMDEESQLEHRVEHRVGDNQAVEEMCSPLNLTQCENAMVEESRYVSNTMGDICKKGECCHDKKESRYVSNFGAFENFSSTQYLRPMGNELVVKLEWNPNCDGGKWSAILHHYKF